MITGNYWLYWIIAIWGACSVLSILFLTVAYNEDWWWDIKSYAPAFIIFAPVFFVVFLVALIVRSAYQIPSACSALWHLFMGAVAGDATTKARVKREK